MWNPKYDINQYAYKSKTDSQVERTDLWLPRGRRGMGGKDWKFGISKGILLYIGYCIAQRTIFNIL